MHLEIFKLATEWAKIVGAVVVFGIGLWQYAKAQKWKRREFIATQMKEFESDEKIQLAMTMLDWNDRVLYFPSEASDKPIAVKVDDALICSALLPHQLARRYSKEEELIRDCFDRFLDMLVRLWNFVDAGLINTDELRPYIQYWIKLISTRMPNCWHEPEMFLLLLNHIQVYGFTGAALLIESFGYNPQPSEADLNKAIKVTGENRSKEIWHSDPDHVSKSPQL